MNLNKLNYMVCFTLALFFAIMTAISNVNLNGFAIVLMGNALLSRINDIEWEQLK